MVLNEYNEILHAMWTNANLVIYANLYSIVKRVEFYINETDQVFILMSCIYVVEWKVVKRYKCVIQVLHTTHNVAKNLILILAYWRNCHKKKNEYIG